MGTLNVRWLAANTYYLDVRVNRPGGQDRIRETFHGTRHEAEARYIALRKHLQDSQALRGRFDRFADLLRHYEKRRNGLPYREKSLAEGLARDLGDVPLAALPARLEEYLAHVRRAPSKKTGRPLAAGTVNRMLVMIRAAYNAAVASEMLERNPITLHRFPPLKTEARDVVLSSVDFDNLLAVLQAEAPHLVPITLFASLVPSRLAELTGALRAELDLFRMVIRIPPARSKSGRGILKPVPPALHAYMRAIPSGSPWIFYREEAGECLPLVDIRKQWVKCTRLAGVEGFQFRDLRHQAATALLNAGNPTPVVQQIGGWQSPRMLHGIYYHPDAAKAAKNVTFPDVAGTPSGYTPREEGGKEAAG